MGEILFSKIQSRFFDIRPGETIICFALFLYFFLITMPYTIIKSVRDAKYLIEEGSLKLPVAYFWTAVLIGFVVAFHSKLQVKIKRRILIISSLVFFIITCVFFSFFFLKRWDWVPLAFWIWANIFVVILMTQFWILVNDAFNPREAKRLIGFFGSGGILGAVVGGLITGLLARKFPDYLLPIASVILIFSIFIVNYIFILQGKKEASSSDKHRKDKKDTAALGKVGFIDCLNTVRKNNYLKLLATVVALTLIVSTFIDWQSKNIIENKVHMNDMTSFFGYFNGGLMILPFLLQLFFASNLIKRYGIQFTLLLYPIILVICSLGVAISPGMIFAIMIKGGDKTLSFSLNQSVRELLYIPISSELKYKAKIFIDMFLNRFAKGIGALILMVFYLYIHLEVQARVQIVSLITILFISAWIFFNLKVSKEYTYTVGQKLGLKWERAEKLVGEKLDVDFMKSVLDTIESKNRSSTLYMMSLFDLVKQDRLTPEVKKLMSSKLNEVNISSLETLFETEEPTFFLETEDAMSREEFEKNIKEIMALDNYQQLMKGYVEKVLEKKDKEAETAKMELAKGIGFMEPDSPLAQKLEEFLRDDSLEVSRYAIESAARLKKREYVPELIQKLLSPITREDALAALEKFGPKIAGTLSDYLEDVEEDIEVRKGAAAALARICNQDAVDSLMLALLKSPEELSREIIDALDKIRSEKKDIHFEKEIVRSQITKEIKNFRKIFTDFYSFNLDQKEEKRQEDIAKSLDDFLTGLFKLLGLIYPYDDINKAFQNIQTGTKDSVAYAVELLDNTLHKDLRDLLIPLIETLAMEGKTLRHHSLLKAFALSNKKR